MLHAGKQGLQAVIVALRDRIEFVVVALCTTDRQCHEGLRRGGDHIVQIVVPLLAGELDVGAADHVVGAGDEESGGHTRAALVASELLADELPVGDVAVDRIDHIVAIGPGVGPCAVGLVAVALGKANHVEPVLAPLLAIMVRRQQPIDQLFVGVGGGIRHEGGHFLGRGR